MVDNEIEEICQEIMDDIRAKVLSNKAALRAAYDKSMRDALQEDIQDAKRVQTHEVDLDVDLDEAMEDIQLSAAEKYEEWVEAMVEEAMVNELPARLRARISNIGEDDDVIWATYYLLRESRIPRDRYRPLPERP